ncbi:Phenylphosphate carboxylase, beta subunit [uncultured Desulfatiglans sp.]|uniref:Phenylphosphate carboxylase, beta subunit n=1 Tax=Uncultured Desulfatiglans sp. TaxID=1748965 RepID=A0A653AA76_UNCDX|nr:Phenylphosphate carboxylase, beta subunit [uncultured Desulfatiglans sp.]
MAYADIREFIEKLKAEGELCAVTAEVDWKLELSHIAKLNEEQHGPALLFQNVKGYAGMPVFTSALATPERLALALGLEKNTSFIDIVKTWVARVREKVPVKRVEGGPCKEKIVKGDDIDLFAFPVPQYYEGDGGRYIGTTNCIISRDPDSGWVNLGTHRMQILDKKRAGIWMIPGKHVELHLQKYRERGEKMPVAVAIGVDPVLFLCSSGPMPAEEDEYEFAGAIRQAPVEVCSAELSDLPVPAAAEMILEGYVDPNELAQEGPFGEYSGYYQASYPKNFLEVECITHRMNPIHWGCTTGRPVTDIHMLMALNRTAQLWADIDRMGIPGIVGVYCPPETGGYYTAIVAVRQTYPGQARQAAMAVAASSAGAYSTKLIVVVDDDIDPTNLSLVWWAIGMRYQPERGTDILRRGRASHVDPSLRMQEGQDYTSRIIIDATVPFEWPKDKSPQLIQLTESVKNQVLRRWNEIFAGSK